MSKAWVYQDDKQVKKHGEAKASWYCGWLDGGGKRRCKSCGPGKEGKRLADKEAVKIHAQLVTGTFESKDKTSWEGFLAEYKKLVLDGMSSGSRTETELSLKHFQRIMKPKKVATISTADLATFVARRRKEQSGRGGSLVSPATVNKEVRQLRAVLRKARKLGYLAVAPEFEFIKEPRKLPTWVPPDEFAKLYHACGIATRPVAMPYPAADWWRGFLVFAMLTGWRVGSILALRRDDVDFGTGVVVSRAEDNKGRRDQAISLNPLALDHLKKVPSFEPVFFPWPHGRGLLYKQFEAVQVEARVKPARKRRYTFHDLRRSFATLNAGRLSADVLQAMMQHTDYSTTRRYIDLARQLRPAAHDVFVPDLGATPGDDAAEA